MSNLLIELTVNNHAGVMSHVVGLFARRGFNIESIVCDRLGVGEQSRIVLAVAEDGQLPQLVKQLEKLYDVIEVRMREGALDRGNLSEYYASVGSGG